MTDLYLLEPEPAPAWFPFADCRPIAELRAGAWLIRERWEAIVGDGTRAIFGPPHLHGFAEEGVPPVESRRPVDGPALIGMSRFAPTGTTPELPPTAARLVNDGLPVGWWVPGGATWDGDVADAPALEVEGVVLSGAYDVVTALEHFLVADAADFTHEPGDAVADGSLVIGDPGDVVLLGALVEPGVVFDVRQGAVVLEQHTYVKSGTRFEGPVYVGPGCEVSGGSIAHSAFGPRCRVRGEIVSSVFLGYANKSHDGFVGHSVIGRWVNLGAGTTTSNLKNTYGPVRVEVAGERLETGRRNLGALIGDHAKTAIGTMLPTGSVVGTGANVFGPVPPPKHVAPFQWGADGTMTREGFLEIAARVLPRRQVSVTDDVRDALGRIYDHAAP